MIVTHPLVVVSMKVVQMSKYAVESSVGVALDIGEKIHPLFHVDMALTVDEALAKLEMVRPPWITGRAGNIHRYFRSRTLMLRAMISGIVYEIAN